MPQHMPSTPAADRPVTVLDAVPHTSQRTFQPVDRWAAHLSNGALAGVKVVLTVQGPVPLGAAGSEHQRTEPGGEVSRYLASLLADRQAA